jgi:hypothetical protein
VSRGQRGGSPTVVILSFLHSSQSVLAITINLAMKWSCDEFLAGIPCALIDADRLCPFARVVAPDKVATVTYRLTDL